MKTEGNGIQDEHLENLKQMYNPEAGAHSTATD